MMATLLVLFEFEFGATFEVKWMVTVRLSNTSSTRRLNINPKQEITREEGIAVPLKWAAIRLSDPNLFFVFDEGDRLELSELNERFQLMLANEMGKAELNPAELIEELLPTLKPKKLSLPKSPIKKTKVETKPKSLLKK